MNATTTQSKWFSSNPDKAFAEKLCLIDMWVRIHGPIV